ncbi:MAG: hypothetical protein H7222_10845 [Methylotenera sp.]|nr:hypothetical protein [Oligoflexia bacterium]
MASGCNGGGGGGSVTVVTQDPYAPAWYDMYGSSCGHGNPRPGCNYYSNGWKIIDSEDPYFTSQYYVLNYDTYYVNGYYYTGYAWTSPDGVIYDEAGNALNATVSNSRDIIADVAAEETAVVESAGKAFAAKYQLDEKVGIQVARTLNDWATLSKDRSKTSADIEAFTQRLYGVDFNSVKTALTEAATGNNDAMKATVAQAAASWGTSPETMKEILNTWYKNQIPGLE